MGKSKLKDIFGGLTNNAETKSTTDDAEAKAKAEAEAAAAAEKAEAARVKAEKAAARAAKKKQKEEEAAAAAAAEAEAGAEEVETTAVVETTTDADDDDETETETETLPVKASPADVAVRSKSDSADLAPAATVANLPLGEVGGEIDNSDLIIPRVSVVQSVGGLSEDFPPGCLVVDGEAIILDLPDDRTEAMKHSEPAAVIILKAVKAFRECLDYNNAEEKELIPGEYLTEDEVVRNKGRVNWETGKGNYRPVLNLLLAIVADNDDIPSGADEYFIDSYGDESFCICNMRLFKSAYTRAAKGILTDAARILRKREGGTMSSRYGLRIERQKAGDNLIWVPTFKLLPKDHCNSPELMEFFRELIG